METKKDIVLFLDKVGRTLVGEIVDTTETTYKIKNPAVMQIGQNPVDRKLSVQLLPFVLFEMIDINVVKEYVIEYNKGDINIVKNVDGTYATPAQHFIETREKLFNALRDGTFLKPNSEPEVLEAK